MPQHCKGGKGGARNLESMSWHFEIRFGILKFIFITLKFIFTNLKLIFKAVGIHFLNVENRSLKSIPGVEMGASMRDPNF